jgi:glutaredoxin
VQTCPKCRHVHQPQEAAPARQCPACGVAYAKASEGLRAPAAPRPVVYQAQAERSYPWLKWLLVLALAYGAWAGFQAMSKRWGSPSNADYQALAASVKPGEVMMYSTNECVYCAHAKGWLQQNGFAFTECNMSVSRECEREFLSYGGNGTPYLVVRGKHMKDGFDSDQFLALLKG